MKKFEFHLQKLLSYKGQLLDSEMTTMSVLNDLLKSAQSKLSSLEAQLTACRQELQECMQGDISPTDCRLHANYLTYLREQVKAQREEVRKATEKVNAQIEVIKQLKLDSKSLEILKDTKYEEYRKEANKKAELQIDEFVSFARMKTAGIS